MKMKHTYSCQETFTHWLVSMHAVALLFCGLFGVFRLDAAQSIPGYVVGWGDNTSGEATGIPSVTFTNGEFDTPKSTYSAGAVVVAGQLLTDAVAVTAGGSFSLALRKDGTAVGWGGNWFGAALGQKSPYPGRGTGPVRLDSGVLRNLGAVAAGARFSMGLRTNGTIICWGETAVAVQLTDIVSVTANCYETAHAVKKDGSVIYWTGEKTSAEYGQLETVPGLSNVAAIAVGEAAHGPRAIALKRDGTVALLHEDRHTYKIETPPAGLSHVVALAAGSGHTLALKNDGTVLGWGLNGNGEATGQPNPNPTNSYSSGTVSLNGTILTNVVSIAANNGYSMALKKDGTIVAWGGINHDARHPVTVPAGLSNVVAIAAGRFHCLAITTNPAVAARFRN